MSGTNRELDKLEKAIVFWNQGRFRESAELYRIALAEHPELARAGFGINLAHSIILSTDWREISKNLSQGINYLECSGWLNSLRVGKPINHELKPVPWYTYPAIEFIENKLNKNIKIFEFGSGNSTRWFSERVQQVVSVESDSEWLSYLQGQISANVELYLIKDENKYASKILEYPEKYFDIIVIDGNNRNKCTECSINRLKDKGFIIFDNTDDKNYNDGINELFLEGFKRIDFYGLIPSYTYKNCTSIFFKDDSFLYKNDFPSEKQSCLGRSCFQMTNPNPIAINDNRESKSISVKLSPEDGTSLIEERNEFQLKTPVCLIIFNRPDTTEKVFEAIRKAKPPKLLVIADGPRANRPGETEKCAAAREIINRVDWDCEVLTNYSDINLGCRKRVSSGLNWVFDLVEEAIILEDDCLPHPTFFRFCEELLERYRHNEQIMVISGNNFQFGRKHTEYSYYFSIYNHIWGWASWRRAWQLYDVAMKMWPKVRESNRLWNLLQDSQAVTLWSKFFQTAYDGFDTWAMPWTFACWSNNGLSILPHVNLVSNIGFGSEATHTKEDENQFANIATEAMNFPLQHPPFVIRDTQADDFTENTMFSGLLKQAQTLQKDWIIHQAIAQLNAHNNTEALNLLEEAIASSPEMPGLNYGKAIALARLGRIDEAVESVNRLLTALPNHQLGKQLLAELCPTSEREVQEMLEQATKLLLDGKKVEALRLAETAASLGVYVPELHYLRAACFIAVGRHAEALEAAKQELANNPSHAEAQSQVEFFTKALAKPKPVKIPTEQRPWKSDISHELLMSIHNAIHHYSYRGVPLLKNPFDFSLYPLLIWNLKPRTIIEIGSQSGGSAIWFGDLLKNFDIDGHIYSIDIIKVTQFSHPRVTFMEGDGQALHQTLSRDFLNSLPRPFLIIEDADHSYETSKAVLDFFHPYIELGEYIVIEDGIISDFAKGFSYTSQPHIALKAFLAEHRGEYEIDSEYCDFFGYNVTWCTNGFLRKIEKSSIAQEKPQLVSNLINQAQKAIETNSIEEALGLLARAKADKQPTQGLDTLRATCFLRLNLPAAALQALYEELRYFPGNAEAKAICDRILAQYPHLTSSQIEDAEFQELLEVIRPYTMLSEERLYSLFCLAKRICTENIPGNFVECGVAGGGSTALMAATIKRYTLQPRWLYAFDSFEGMPMPTARDRCDGIPADATGWGTGTCAAPEASVREVCAKLGVTEIVMPVKGDFRDTLPKMRNGVGAISLLHMDGDWYESTKAILHNLYDRVVNDGFIQVDDYGHWEGCRQAVHEFEALRQIKFDINPIDGTGVWFSCPNQFPMNPDLELVLVAELAEDDPVAGGIQSQMSPNERFQLYYALRKLLPNSSSPVRFVEIGSFAGSSLFLTCKALKRIASQLQGFAIEPGGHPQFYEVLKHLQGDVTHLRMFSHQAAPQLRQLFEQDGKLPIFIFVDGDHSYEGVRQDIIDYFPLLAPGGIMMFHDYLPPLNDENRQEILFHHAGNEPGIRQACQELMENTYGCEVIHIPLLYPTDPTQSQAYLPIIPGVFSTIRAYRKPQV